jgi:hypothetical protein
MLLWIEINFNNNILTIGPLRILTKEANLKYLTLKFFVALKTIGA